MVKAVTLAFCNIQRHFIKDIRAKFGIPYSPRSPDIEQDLDRGISDFRISGQSLIKENCHNSRTRDDIDIKLGPVTKLDKRNKTTSKKLTMASYRKLWRNWHFFNLQPISSYLEAGFRVHAKLMLSLLVTFNLAKTENKKSLRQLQHHFFE